MGQVDYNKNYRRLWMFPRNIRRILPWKLSQIMQLLVMQLADNNWKGNQALQDSLYRSLVDIEVKRPGSTRDPKSGGMRTYLAQLICLGLLFQDESGIYSPTIAGESILNGENPLGALQSVLFRHQYPSSYGLNRNVMIHPQIRIKPFLFISKFLHDSDIDCRLNDEELAVLIIYGHNPGQYNFCKEKILKIRNGSPLEKVIDDYERDLYTPRSKSHNRLIENALDIANTAKNYLQAALLIKIFHIPESNKEIFTFNQDFENLYDSFLAEEDNYTSYPEQIESFQRAYGRFDRTKDNRRFAESARTFDDSRIIKSLFYKYSEKNVFNDLPNEFVDEVSYKYGIEKDRVYSVTEPLLGKQTTVFEDNYLALAYSGTGGCTEFEIATAEIFQKKFRFEAHHTGQKKRPRKQIGGYADIFLIALDNKHCAIVDTKASPRYALSSTDFLSMSKNYIMNYKELIPIEHNLNLEFGLYVAGGFSGNNEAKLLNIYQTTGVRTSMISASNLLKLSNSRLAENQEDSRFLFSLGKEIEVNDFIGGTL
jgi:hypothetical protein